MIMKSPSYDFSVKPYAEIIRFWKPAGTLLVFFPFAFSLSMAAYATKLPLQDYVNLTMNSLLWAFLARSMACTINDICDRDIDGEVERTKSRPFVSGKISLKDAVIFLIIQAAILFLAIFKQGCQLTFRYSLAWFPLIFIYPFMKRITNWPQVWLGVAINWGVVLAWPMATSASIDAYVIASLMVSLWAWTMLYDTIYACQDKADDLKIGVGSSAIGLDTAVYPALCLFGSVFVCALAVAGYANKHGPAFFIISVGGAAVEIVLQLTSLHPEDPGSCRKSLVRNSYLGCVIWSGILIDYLMKSFIVF